VGGDGDQLGRLEAEAARLGIGGRVDFLGFVTSEAKLGHLRGAWLHVLTSPKEGWGISNLEAAACATPSVVSDAPGLRESVVDGRTGILVPHGDVAGLSRALAGLLGDATKRDQMGRQAREFAESFSWGATGQAFERYLIRLVTGGARG
jgi:glycosyltransferase involved in cell wall biosynthesis